MSSLTSSDYAGYVFCFFTRMSVNRHDEDNQERVKKSDEYLKRLDTPDGTICLAKLTPANAFEMCPIYLSINVRLNEDLGSDKKRYEKSVKRQIDEMAKAMNKFTDNRLNAQISMGYQNIIYLYDGKRTYNWTFIKGEQVSNVGGVYYERHVYDSYKGVFW